MSMLRRRSSSASLGTDDVHHLLEGDIIVVARFVLGGRREDRLVPTGRIAADRPAA